MAWETLASQEKLEQVEHELAEKYADSMLRRLKKKLRV